MNVRAPREIQPGDLQAFQKCLKAVARFQRSDMAHYGRGVMDAPRISPTSRHAGPLEGVVSSAGDDESHVEAVVRAGEGRGFPVLMLAALYRVRS